MLRSLRSLLFVLLSFALVSEAAAQARSAAPPVTFSVAGGINVSRLNVGFLPDDDILQELGISFDNGSRVGLVAGGLVDFRVAPGVGIVTGGLFSTRGGTIDVDIPELDIPGLPIVGGNVKFDLRMIYVDVPAFVSVGVAKSGDQRFDLLGGAMIGFKADATMKISALGVSTDEDFGDGVPAVDFGLSVGGRYSCGHIFAAAYYTWGLTDITETDTPDPIKHRYLTVLGGWRF